MKTPEIIVLISDNHNLSVNISVHVLKRISIHLPKLELGKEGRV